MHDYVARHNTSLAVVAAQLFEQLLAEEAAKLAATSYEAEQV